MERLSPKCSDKEFPMILKRSTISIRPRQLFIQPSFSSAEESGERRKERRNLKMAALINHQNMKRETAVSEVQLHRLPSLTLSGYLAVAERLMTTEIWRPIDMFHIASRLCGAPVG
jgi:hypothetical protein